MRKLTRKRTNAIPRAFRGGDRVNKNLELLRAERDVINGNQEKHKFPSNWSPAKKQLLRESHNKCAYCESPTTIVSYGDVEHYRPKSKYWWLAYCYDNYLASCQMCNQKYKKAKFKLNGRKMVGPPVNGSTRDRTLNALAKSITPDPLNASLGKSWTTYEREHHRERPLLINPYIDDPNDYFIWKVDHVNRYVSLAPKDKSDQLHIDMVEASEEDFGINRKELCNHRYDTYVSYCGARLTLELAVIPTPVKEMQERIKDQLMSERGAYVGMLRYFDSLATVDLDLPSS